MSLKGVHILFIVFSIAVAVMMSVWALRMYSSPLGSAGHLSVAVLSLLSAAALVLYAVKFVRKTRRIRLQ